MLNTEGFEKNWFIRHAREQAARQGMTRFITTMTAPH